MARTITVGQLIIGGQRLADLENANNRFSAAELLQYCNQAVAYVYRKMITVSDMPFFQKQAPDITMQGGQTIYPLPQDFLSILSVIWSGGSINGPWALLESCTEAERVELINAAYCGGITPRKFMTYGDGGTGAYTQGTIPTAYSIEILPGPTAGGVVRIRYVPSAPMFQQTSDIFDGIMGFDDAVSIWIAVLMRRKDDLPTDDLERDFQRIMGEITVIARHRDRSGPPRVTIRRGRGYFGGRRRGGFTF